MDDDACGPDEWAALACAELKAARILGRQQMWRQAYQHAGLALEMGLKAAIMRRRGLNRWPSRQEEPRLHTHQLDALASEADLDAILLQEVMARSNVGKAWLVAKDFTVMHRYPGGNGFPNKLGQDMLAAADEGGLLTWLLSRTR